MIGEWITRSHILCNRVAPAPDELSLIAPVWDDALACIPTARLVACLRLAVQSRRDPWPIAAGDVLAAWDEDRLLRASTAGRVELGLPALPAPSAQTSIIGPLRGTLRTLAATWGEVPTNAELLAAAVAIRRAAPGLTLEQFRPLLVRAAWALRRQAADAPRTLAALVTALEGEAPL